MWWLAAATAMAARQEATAGDVTLAWDATDAVTRKTGVETRLFHDVAEESNPDDPDAKDDYTMLSVVGPIATYSHEWYADTGAHPSYGTQWTAVDFTTGKPVSMRALWSDDVLLAALLGDKVVRGALGPGDPPKTLDELWSRVDGGCEMYLGAGMLEAFAFHHVEGDHVAVRVGIGAGCEVMRGNFAQLGLLLPIPKGYEAPLAAATAEKRLMAHLSQR